MSKKQEINNDAKLLIIVLLQIRLYLEIYFTKCSLKLLRFITSYLSSLKVFFLFFRTFRLLVLLPIIQFLFTYIVYLLFTNKSISLFFLSSSLGFLEHFILLSYFFFVLYTELFELDSFFFQYSSRILVLSSIISYQSFPQITVFFSVITNSIN
jgi:hypothetical protein